MMDEFRMELLTKLSSVIDNEQLKSVSDILDVMLPKYEVNTRTTELAVYNNEIPNEIKSFLVCKSIKGLTDSSLQHYKRTLNHFALNITKDIKLLTANDIRLYFLSYEKTRNTGKSTIDDKRRVLNSFYSWMLSEEIITKNPMLKIDAIKCDKKVKEPLTVMELEKMRMACTNVRSSALLEMLYSTGCRISELLALNKSDINYETGRIKVYGKGKKERFVFLNAKAQLAIKKYIFSRNDDNEALFVISKKPYSRMGKGTAEKEIKQLGVKAGIKRNVFCHLLRATMATHLLSHGANITEVQAILGHASVNTTNIYAKTNCDDLQYKFMKCII